LIQSEVSELVMKTNFYGIVSCFVFSAILISTVGCGGGQLATDVNENNKTNIQKLLNLITLHQKRTNKAAESADMLREWLATSNNIDQNLELMGIDKEKLDEYLVSDRDGEPFDVRWGTFMARGGASEPYVFEKVGIEGIRQVMWTSGGGITEVDEEEYDKLRKGQFERKGKRTQ
jgi:hypothetical protein